MSQILSDELLLKIFYYLNVNELCIVCRVSKDWYRISNDEQLWKALYAQRWTPVVEIRLVTIFNFPSKLFCFIVYTFHL